MSKLRLLIVHYNAGRCTDKCLESRSSVAGAASTRRRLMVPKPDEGNQGITGPLFNPVLQDVTSSPKSMAQANTTDVDHDCLGRMNGGLLNNREL